MTDCIEKNIKCIVWDLDHTIWDGVLLEDSCVSLKEGIREIISTLDERGILQSIASKNEYSAVMLKLKEYGIDKYFLYPQINWSSKASSIKKIAQLVNINTSTIAFIDDQQYELDEVKYEVPDVKCIHAEKIFELLTIPETNPTFISDDSRKRRQLYLCEIQRNSAEQNFIGPKEEFLRLLNMELSIFHAQETDLERAIELTVRTNQLNATGYTYSYEELDYFRQSSEYMLLMMRLKDKYGEYGNIGLSLVELKNNQWSIKLLLMSCRVMSRGVGSLLLSYIINLAKKEKKELLAEFLPNNNNRMMNITFKFMRFQEYKQKQNVQILKHDLDEYYQYPNYIKVTHD